MQLSPITKAFKPVTLAAGIMTTMPIFAYSDVDTYSNIINSEKIVQYMRFSDAKENDYISLKSRFDLHFQRWKKKTMFLSSVNKIVGDKDFQAIVSMGTLATPFILDEIANQPSTLVWALNYIYSQKISTRSNLTIAEACKLWMKAF